MQREVVLGTAVGAGLTLLLIVVILRRRRNRPPDLKALVSWFRRRR